MAFHEYTIEVADPLRDLLIQKLAALGSLGVIEHDTFITAFFADSADSSAINRELSLLQDILRRSDSADSFSFTYRSLPDQDWNDSWKKGFIPLDIGARFTILPPWERQHASRINLVIDPGMAFGTGHHETTRSCLVLMERYAGKAGKERFLDLGTGTGLLAIAALKLGYKKVTAVDTDPLSIEAVARNIELNHAGGIELLRGSIADVYGTFDVIAANIISGVLVQLAPDIVSSLDPGGIVILSGILAEQADEIVGAYERSGMTIRELYPDGKWISIVACR